MPFPPRPQSDPNDTPNGRVEWERYFTRRMMATYLLPVGDSSRTTERVALLADIEGTGWLETRSYPERWQEMANNLWEMWGYGRVYALTRQYLQYVWVVTEREHFIAHDLRRHVGGFGGEPQAGQEPPPRDVEAVRDRVVAGIRVAISQTRATLPILSHHPRVCARLPVVYDEYLTATPDADDNHLLEPINARLETTGQEPASRDMLFRDLREIRNEQFRRLQDALAGDDNELSAPRVVFHFELSEGEVLGSARRNALDKLVRAVHQGLSIAKLVGGGPQPCATLAPRVTSQLRQWWEAWPTDNRRPRWDAVFAYYNSAGELDGVSVGDLPPTPNIPQAERFAVLDEMSAEFQYWWESRRKRK